MQCNVLQSSTYSHNLKPSREIPLYTGSEAFPRTRMAKRTANNLLDLSSQSTKINPAIKKSFVLDFIIRKRIYLLYLEAMSLQRWWPPDRRWGQEPAWPSTTSSSALIRVFGHQDQLTHSLQIVSASAGRSRKRFNVAKSKSDPTPNLVVAQQSSNGKSRNWLKV